MILWNDIIGQLSAAVTAGNLISSEVSESVCDGPCAVTLRRQPPVRLQYRRMKRCGNLGHRCQRVVSPRSWKISPDDILLIVLQQLLEWQVPSTIQRKKTLARVSRLNKRFNRLASLPCLWQTLDFGDAWSSRGKKDQSHVTARVLALCAQSGSSLRSLVLPTSMIDADGFARIVADSPNLEDLTLKFQDAQSALKFSRDMIRLWDRSDGARHVFPHTCRRLDIKMISLRRDESTDWQSLAWLWDHCSNLESLCLQWSCVAMRIPTNVNLMQLTELVIDGEAFLTDNCMIQLLDAAPNLHRLSVRRRPAQYPGLIRSVPGLQHILQRTSWTRLTFLGCGLAPTDLTPRLTIPESLPQLQSLHISSVTFRDESCEELLAFVEGCAMPALQELRLDGVQPDTFEEMCRGHMLPRLRKLVLRRMSHLGQVDIARFLSRTPEVTEFDLSISGSRSVWGRAENSQLLRLLSTTLTKLTHLRQTIYLWHTDTPETIQDCLPVLNNLKTAAFNVSDLPRASWPPFFSALQSLVSLKLEAPWRAPFPEGVQLPSLQSLTLSLDAVGGINTGIWVIVSWLQACPRLTELCSTCPRDVGQVSPTDWQDFLNLLKPLHRLTISWQVQTPVPQGTRFHRLKHLDFLVDARTVAGFCRIMGSWLEACPKLETVEPRVRAKELAWLPLQCQRRLKGLGVKIVR